MNASSERRLTKLHPRLVSRIRSIAAELTADGVHVEVVQGYRTFEEQDALYAKGRTKPGQVVTQARGGESNHNYGLAADLCPFVNQQPAWDAPLEVWTKIGRTAERHGLEWGGSWKKFLDKPHVQLPAMPVSRCKRCFARGGLPAVWAELPADA